ncbi:MAG: hypothetical protein KKA56_14410, partial [Gammaproteobacteria bacterium]|nr:hypothetical protein [Gammaproteobacteria bacterium]
CAGVIARSGLSGQAICGEYQVKTTPIFEQLSCSAAKNHQQSAQNHGAYKCSARQHSACKRRAY